MAAPTVLPADPPTQGLHRVALGNAPEVALDVTQILA
jgi:hypothetical protein